MCGQQPTTGPWKIFPQFFSDATLAFPISWRPRTWTPWCRTAESIPRWSSPTCRRFTGCATRCKKVDSSEGSHRRRHFVFSVVVNFFNSARVSVSASLLIEPELQFWKTESSSWSVETGEILVARPEGGGNTNRKLGKKFPARKMRTNVLAPNLSRSKKHLWCEKNEKSANCRK